MHSPAGRIYPLRVVPLRFEDEARAGVLLLLRLALDAVLLGLTLALFAAPRPKADLALADLAALTFAPAAFAPAFLAALLVVLRAVVRDAEAGLAALLDRVVRELDARLVVLRALVLRALGLLAGLRPGVIDLASCSMSLISDRFVVFASRRNVRSVSARSLYAVRALLPNSARIVCSA